VSFCEQVAGRVVVEAELELRKVVVEPWPQSSGDLAVQVVLGPDLLAWNAIFDEFRPLSGREHLRGHGPPPMPFLQGFSVEYAARLPR
jgi:hypothetical protein